MLDIAKERNFISTRAFVPILLFILFHCIYICNDNIEIKYVLTKFSIRPYCTSVKFVFNCLKIYAFVGKIKMTVGSISCNTSKMVKLYILQMVERMIFVKSNFIPKI